jgi:trafficking protein particle complex subunit 12
VSSASASVASTPELPPSATPAQVEQSQALPEPAATQTRAPKVDLGFLQDKGIYHAIPLEDVFPGFLNSELQPPGDTPLPELLDGGHFRRAADASVRLLLQCQSNDAEQILQLLYTRLACLVLVSRPDIAVQEALPLTELLARNAPGAKDFLPLIPWELRVLLVRLQSMGATDGGRRGIMALYGLAAEIRTHLRKARDGSDAAECQKWSDRLHDVGLRVADALVEMGELETASRHLDTVSDTDNDEIAYRKALLRVRVGDVTGAERSLNKIQDDHAKGDLAALLKITNGDYLDACTSWHKVNNGRNRELGASNFGVAMLYTGRIAEARQILEELVNQGQAFPGLLFNLSTIYELCTERAMTSKQELADRVVLHQPAAVSGGWEKATFDFKL